MGQPRRGRVVWVGLSVGLCLWAAPVSARQALSGHRSARMAAAALAGELPDAGRVHLAVSFPLRDPAKLKALLARLYDPHSPDYHHFLKPQEFNRQFGLSDQDYRKAVAFFGSRGMTVASDPSHRVVLDLEGTVKGVQDVFHTRLRRYQHKDGRTFFAPDADPSLDLDLPVAHVAGLDDFDPPRPRLRAEPRGALPVAGSLKPLAAGPPPRPLGGAPAPLAGGSAYAGLFAGNDFRRAYASCSPWDGTGQAIALVEFSNYHPADVSGYLADSSAFNGFTPGPGSIISNVYLDGLNPSTPAVGLNYYLEVALDIDMAVSMAPNSAINVYLGQIPDSVLSRIANDDQASQISCSWLWTPDATEAALYQQFAAQGQSFLQASGDEGALQGDPADNRDQPLQTLVGGTSLTLSGNGAAWAGETVWNEAPWTSSGGIFSSVPIPDYQQGVPMGANGGSLVFRNGPDVAAVASGVFQVDSAQGQIYEVIGTSCAAPLWAGLLALANQAASAAGRPPVGFANPTLYRLAQDPAFGGTLFHDITVGNNLTTGPIGYNAVPGYDLATGWGSPHCQLPDALAGALRDTPTPTHSATPSVTPTGTPTASPSASVTATRTATPSASLTPTPSVTVTRTPSPGPQLCLPAMANAAVAASGGMQLSNDLVDSYDSGAGAYGGGNVGSSAGVRAAAAISGFANVHGPVTPNSPAASTPVPTPAGLAGQGALVVNSGQSLVLAPGDYLLSSLTVNSGGVLSSTGLLRLWVTGAVNVNGQVLGAHGLPGQLWIFGTGSGPVTVNSGALLKAVIDAPQAALMVNGTVQGALVGATLAMNGGASLHYDRALGNGSCSPLPTPTAGVTMDGGIPCVALDHALIGNQPGGDPNGTVIINSQTLVDSYDSSLGAYNAALPGGGRNVSAQGDILSAAGIILNSNPTGVQGTVTLNDPLHLPVIGPPASAVNKGAVLVVAGQTLTLGPGDYVFSDLQEQWGATITVTGPVRVWVTGTLLLGGKVNGNASPCGLQFFLTGTNDLNMNAQSAVYALIYAPVARVNINQVLYGSVVGGNVVLNSPAQVHLDLACRSVCAPPTPSRTRTPVPSATFTATPSATPSVTMSATFTPSPSVTATPSVTQTPTISPTFTPREIPLAGQGDSVKLDAAVINAALRLAPNPASGLVQVAYRLPCAGQAFLLISALDGKPVLQRALGPQSAGPHLATLDLGGLPNGLYFATLLRDSGGGSCVEGRFKLAVLH